MHRNSVLMVSILSLLLLPIAGVSGETKDVTGSWAVSDGGGVEAGGHVTILGLPETVIFGKTYTVNFQFKVEWFDWGSNIRPQTIQWFARVGCLQEESTPIGIFCTRNSQNITLDNSVVPGSYKQGEAFNVSAFWNLAESPSSWTGTASARLGLKIGALVECLDSSKCSPVGQGNPAQKFSYISPETSTSFTVVSSEWVGALLSPYGLIGIGFAVAVAGITVGIFLTKRMRRKGTILKTKGGTIS